jgi:hypothetical protein
MGEDVKLEDEEEEEEALEVEDVLPWRRSLSFACCAWVI